MIDESVKFAWAYLLKHGRPTTGKWCYYSGWERIDGKWFGWEEQQLKTQQLIDETVKVGIDWEKSGVPEVKEESQFTDTFSPSRDCLATLGTLVLKNGKTYILGSDKEDAAHLAETARKMLKKEDNPLQDLANLL